MVLSPTWFNGRAGRLSISKRLDRFFMAYSLCASLGNYRTWHHSSGIFDHHVVVLQIDFDTSFIRYPYNFNPTWLKEVVFDELI